jgi:hypothetical protein
MTMADAKRHATPASVNEAARRLCDEHRRREDSAGEQVVRTNHASMIRTTASSIVAMIDVAQARDPLVV